MAEEDFSFWRTLPGNFLGENSRKSKEKKEKKRNISLESWVFSSDWLIVRFQWKYLRYDLAHTLSWIILSKLGGFFVLFLFYQMFSPDLLETSPNTTDSDPEENFAKVYLLGLKMKNRTIRSYNLVISVSTITSFLEHIVKLNDSAPGQWDALGTFNRIYMQRRL